MHLNKFLVVVLVFLSITFISCRKITQTRIKGTWAFVNIAGQSQKEEEWTFYNEGELSIISHLKTKDSIPYTVTNTGAYKVKAAKKMILSDLPSTIHYYNTSWNIVDLSKTRMLLVNDQNQSAGLAFVELRRVNE